MKQRLKDLVQFVFIFVFVISIQTFVISITEVDGQSMLPTLNKQKGHDRVIVEKISNYTHNYKRGQIVIFKPSENKNEFYIKRIIGLEGDIVEIAEGKVYVNGKQLREDYLSSNIKTEPEMEVKVPKDNIFVLGDNRGNSIDSRNIGTVPVSKIKGHAIYRLNIFSFSSNKLK